MSGLAYLIDALGGLAGGFAQNYNPQQTQSNTDAGNILASIFGGNTGAGGGTGGSGPGGMGGGSYQYQGQTATDLPSATSQPQPGVMGAGPLAAAAATAAQPGTAQPGTPASMAANGGNYGYSAPPQAQPQPQGSNMPSPVGATNQAQGSPAVGQGGASVQHQLGRGPLTLDAAIQQGVKMGLSGRRLIEAIGNPRFLPLLNAEGLQQYRDLGLQLRAQNEQSLAEDRKDRSMDRKQAERDRLQMSNERIQAQSARQQESIKLSLQKLGQAKTLKEAQMHASDLRAAIKDKLEATNHQIQMQYNLTDDQKAELYKQAQEDAKTANENLDKILSEKGKGTSENNKANTQGAQEKAAPKVSDEQKATWKKQAQDAIAAGKDPAWISKKYKELTGEDLGQ